MDAFVPRLRPLSTSPSSQLILYLKTILLPPLGFLWGYRYFRQSDTPSKVIGLFVILVTAIELIWIVQSTIGVIDTVNQQIIQQTSLFGL